jgi:hypothetical protein
MNNNQNNNIKSNIIDLEILQQKYSNVLNDYKQSVNDYVNYLNNKSNKFTSITGQAYLGTNTLSQINNTSLNECSALCSSNSKCSGATFKSNTCILKTGDSTTILASDDTYAIIPEEKHLLLNMEDLNQQLININKQITDKIILIEPDYDNKINKGKNNTLEIINRYKTLMLEREQISKMLNDYTTLSYTENQNEVKITQNYYVYLLYCILTIVLIFLLSKIALSGFNQNISQYGGNLNSNLYFKLSIIFLVLIVIVYFFIYKNK